MHDIIVCYRGQNMNYNERRGHRGRDRTVFGFTTTCVISVYHHKSCEFESHLRKYDFLNIVKTNIPLECQRTDKSKTDRVPLVLTYSKGLLHVREIIKKKMTVLQRSEKMKKGFIKPPILAFRRDKNLKDILVHKSIILCFLNRNISVNLAVGTVLFVRMFVTPIHSPILKEKHLT